MAITLERLPSGGVARATIGSLMILAHMISVASASSRSQQVRRIQYNLVSFPEFFCALLPCIIFFSFESTHWVLLVKIVDIFADESS